MKECKISKDEYSVKISMVEEETTWKEIMVTVIDSLRGLGFVSNQLDNLQEEWYDETFDERE